MTYVAAAYMLAGIVLGAMILSTVLAWRKAVKKK